MKQDVEARFRRAVELLDADDLEDPAEIAAAIEAAANDGDGFAARLAASAAGAGFGRNADLSAAVEWTIVAAERGDAQARAQLTLLSGESGADWRALGAAIDVAAFTAARPTRVVVEEPRIAVAERFLEPRLCAWAIERARPMLETAYIYQSSTGRVARDPKRTNTAATFRLPDLDLPLLLIRERIAQTAGIPAAHFERTSVFHYLPGQTFARHADYISSVFSAEIRRWGQRPLTFLVYLNDAFEGGETHFVNLGQRLRGGVGDALLFRNVDATGAPDERTLHEGAPPTSGEKWLLSQFVRDKPQPPG